MNKCKTREEWLNRFIEEARVEFKRVGSPLPKKVRASIGFTSKGLRGKAIGQCFDGACAKDGVHEIFIRPDLNDVENIADVLTHELVHAAIGLDAGHGPLFKKAAAAIGLEGKATATTAGEGWRAWGRKALKRIGAYPAPSFDPRSSSLPPKQPTRLIKCECDYCGFVFRTTVKWIEASSLPLRCPDTNCGEPMTIN